MSEPKMTSIGGQAVIEGVMMRGPHKIAIAVRKPDGEIIVDEKPTKIKGKIMKVPILRGVISFFDSMVLGVQSLMFSAKFFDVEDDEKDITSNKEEKASEKENKIAKEEKENKIEKGEKVNKKGNKTEKEGKAKKIEEAEKAEGNGMPDWALYLSVIISLLISIGLFFILPNFAASLFVKNKVDNAILYNVVESAVKLVLFGGYLVLASQMKDVRRVFEYHGAEHKSIFCYENGEELTVENVKKYSRFHPRCGTSFLLFVVVISIIIFSLIKVYENGFINAGIRLLLLPIVAGISYEIIKFAGRSKSKWVTWLNAPGKWLQHLTTREPDDQEIEVAITSLKTVIPENKEDDLW